MTYKDLMRFCVQLAAILLVVNVLLFRLPYQLVSLFAEPGPIVIVPFAASLLLLSLAWSLWTRPALLLPKSSEFDSDKPLAQISARMVISSGCVILGLYFFGTGFDDFAVVVIDYSLEFLDLGLDYRRAHYFSTIEIARGVFGLVLIIKAPQIGSYLSRHIDADGKEA